MKEQVRTKNQILDEIDSIKARLEVNRAREMSECESLPEMTRREFVRQEAIFEKHQENEEQWNVFVTKASSALEREAGYSQLCRAEAYRSRLEAAQTFDVLKSDFERFGTRVWYMTLRKSGQAQSFEELRGRKVQIENLQNHPLIIVSM